MSALYARHDSAVHGLGQLQVATALLPETDIVAYSFVRREAALSSQIAGTRSSLSDLMLFELEQTPTAPLGDVRAILNYVNALEYGTQQLAAGAAIDKELICALHKRLFASGQSSGPPGEFRNSQTETSEQRLAAADSAALPADAVEHRMNQLIAFVNDREQAMPTLIHIGLAYADFERIRPFFDGNGRLGRLLIPLLLYQSAMLSQPSLYLSLYLR